MLTDTKARKAQPGDRDYKLADEKGLFLLVRPTGGKLWRLKYRHEGKEKLLSFGPYPEVSLSEARDLRDSARRQLREGQDPSAERRRAKLTRSAEAANSFQSVAEEWLEQLRPRWAEKHYERVKRSLERDVYPTLGAMPVAGIDAPTVLSLLRKIERRGSIETAKRVRQRISAVFVHAISSGVAREDPAAIVEKALKPKPPVEAQPAITDLAALRKLLAQVEGSGASPVTLYASRLLALTAVRPGVVRWAEWGDFLHIDWDSADPAPEALWHVPAAKMKLAQDRKRKDAFDHYVPLAPAAVDVLRAIRRLSGRAPYVFPGAHRTSLPISENAIGKLYNRVGWKGQHVPHGWRAAFSTVMNERAKAAGRDGDRQVIDLMLAHVPSNKVESAYNRAEFMPRRREIAEEWAGLLLEGARPAADLLELSRRIARGRTG